MERAQRRVTQEAAEASTAEKWRWKRQRGAGDRGEGNTPTRRVFLRNTISPKDDGARRTPVEIRDVDFLEAEIFAGPRVGVDLNRREMCCVYSCLENSRWNRLLRD